MVLRIDSGAGSEHLSFADDVRPGAGGGLGQAVGQVSDSLAGFAGHLRADIERQREEQDRQSDALYLAKTTTDFRTAWAKHLNDQSDGYDGAGGGFADDYMKGYRKEAEDVVAKAPARVQTQLATELVNQGGVLASAAAVAEHGKRQSYILNGVNQTADRQAEALVTTPDLFSDAVKPESMNALVAAAPAGVRDKLRIEYGEKFATAYAQGLLDNDPSRLAEELEQGHLDQWISPESKATWLKSAHGAEDRATVAANQAATAAHKALDEDARDLTGRAVAYYNAGLPPPDDLVNAAHDAATKAQNAGAWEKVELARYKFGKDKTESTKTDARASLSDINDALKLGLTPGPEMIDAAVARVRASGSKDLAGDLSDMLALAGKQQEFAFQTPQWLNDRLTSLRGMAATTESTKEVQLLTNVIAGREKAIAGGQLADWAGTHGQPMAPISATDPNLADALSARIRLMAPLSKQVGADLQFFGAKERVTFARELAQLPDDQRLKALGTITAQLGPDAAGTVLKEISKDAPADAQAGLLMVYGRTRAAGDVTAGMAALKSNPKIAPARTSADVQAAEAAVFGRTLLPELTGERAGIGEAARAIYAAGQIRKGADGSQFDQDAYKQALDLAAGGDGTRGGFGKVNGSRTMLPPQLTADDVSHLVKSGAVFDDWTTYSFGYPKDHKPGGMPAFQDPKTGKLEPADAADLKGVKLIAKGGGLYWLSTTDPATGPHYVFDYGTSTDAAPRPFVLDLRRARPPGSQSGYEGGPAPQPAQFKPPAPVAGSAMDKTVAEFPALKSAVAGMAFKNSPAQPGDDRGLEFYPQGERDSYDRTRPAIETFGDKASPSDIAGDIVSHHLAQGADPYLTGVYKKFEQSLTETQKADIRRRYDWSKKHGEDRPFADWYKIDGLPSIFRGYAFKQLDDGDFTYTPGQKAMFDEMMAHLRKKPAGGR